MNNGTNNCDGENNAKGVDISSSATKTSTTPTGTTKEKRSWFHSLTRRKKSESSLAASSSTQAQVNNLQSNNNNEPEDSEPTTSGQAELNVAMPASSGALRKQHKEKKNVFQKIRKRVGIRLSSMRPWRSMNDDAVGGSGTTDATYEFLTHARIDPSLPFTHDYKRFIAKKWLDREDGPNPMMYKACCEMLNQVWYWGEISRRDAQKQLTDKPTGSFLVRDSETSGSQFTLSFRIVNVTLHYRLEYHDDFWHFEELKYKSIVEMIQDILHRCTNDNFVCFVKVPNEMQPPVPVIMKYPLSRYLNIPKLQDLCRRVIQRQVSDVSKLPVPAQMLEYLSVKRELVFQS